MTEEMDTKKREAHLQHYYNIVFCNIQIGFEIWMTGSETEQMEELRVHRALCIWKGQHLTNKISFFKQSTVYHSGYM